MDGQRSTPTSGRELVAIRSDMPRSVFHLQGSGDGTLGGMVTAAARFFGRTHPLPPTCHCTVRRGAAESVRIVVPGGILSVVASPDASSVSWQEAQAVAEADDAEYVELPLVDG